MTVPQWQDKKPQDLLSVLEKEFFIQAAGLEMRFGKPWLLVEVDPRNFLAVMEAAQRLQLQRHEVTAPKAYSFFAKVADGTRADRALVYADIIYQMRKAYPDSLWSSKMSSERELHIHFWSATPLRPKDVRVDKMGPCTISLTYQAQHDRQAFEGGKKCIEEYFGTITLPPKPTEAEEKRASVVTADAEADLAASGKVECFRAAEELRDTLRKAFVAQWARWKDLNLAQDTTHHLVELLKKISTVHVGDLSHVAVQKALQFIDTTAPLALFNRAELDVKALVDRDGVTTPALDDLSKFARDVDALIKIGIASAHPTLQQVRASLTATPRVATQGRPASWAAAARTGVRYFDPALRAGRSSTSQAHTRNARVGPGVLRRLRR